MSKLFSPLLWFLFTAFCDWSEKWRHFVTQWEAKSKQIVTSSHAFSRAYLWFHVIALNSDWFIALFASVVTGQSSEHSI